MKKIILLLLVFFSANFLNAQSFEKGNRIFDVNLGLGIYNITLKDNQKPSDTGATGKAACIALAPAMEWAVGKRISIGTSLLYSHYLSSKDSNGYKPSVNGLDGNFLFNFHFVKSKKADLFTGLRLGIAGFRLNPNDNFKSIYGSMGRAFDFHIGGRFYVSPRTGILVNLAFPRYTFNKFGDSLEYTYTLASKGFCIGTGIAIKLGGDSTSKAKN
ncbi:MAG: hypothetical protein HY841_08600 [Bacteroidetes bacterium]|nr:hypothetical protein [Bacteroidota bacterium]